MSALGQNPPHAKNQKKADPRKGRPESFRRGCLKGMSYVQCSTIFRKCERRAYGCKSCNPQRFRRNIALSA